MRPEPSPRRPTTIDPRKRGAKGGDSTTPSGRLQRERGRHLCRSHASHCAPRRPPRPLVAACADEAAESRSPRAEARRTPAECRRISIASRPAPPLPSRTHSHPARARSRAQRRARLRATERRRPVLLRGRCHVLRATASTSRPARAPRAPNPLHSRPRAASPGETLAGRRPAAARRRPRPAARGAHTQSRRYPRPERGDAPRGPTVFELFTFQAG